MRDLAVDFARTSYVPRRTIGRPRSPGLWLIPSDDGKRRGLEIGGQPEPLYVVRIEPESRRVVVGPRSALAVASARLSDINWLGEDQRVELTAKVRSLARPAPAWFDRSNVHFDAPEYGVSPGQAAVLYQGDRLLGGGWIESTVAAAPSAQAA